MNAKPYILCCSNLNVEIIDLSIIDPLNIFFYSEQFSITARDENEAICAFQESDIYLRFCERYRNAFTYIEGNDGYFRRINGKPLTTKIDHTSG